MRADTTAPIERPVGLDRRVRGHTGVAIGDVLGGTYELREIIHSVPTYELFGAYDRMLGRHVTIKVVAGPTQAESLRREARMLAPLVHQNLAAVHGYGAEREVEYLVLEHLPGTTLGGLRDMRSSRGGLSTQESLSILIGIADGLAVLHAHGYAHRNLTADAVVIASNGRIVVRNPHVVGEVVPGETGDVRTDLQALGFLAYELFTGEGWAGQSLDRLTLPHDAMRVLQLLVQREVEQLPRDAGVVAASLRALRRNIEPGTERPLTIVVADDDPAMRALLNAALVAAAPRAEIHQADDGVSAIDLVEKHQPDLLLLDLDMPRLDGLGVCTYLRGTQARDRLAICVMSTHAATNRSLLAGLGVIDAFEKGKLGAEELPGALGALLRKLRLLPDLAEEAPTSTLVGGRYELGRQLGRGGMGLVYEARHVQLGRPLALKIISPQYALDAAARARFNQEARLASEIVHPNLVTVIDYGEDRHIGPYTVMELIDGQSLADLAPGRMSLRRACDMLGQVADAMSQIHARGIVHGDIKAENIIVVDEQVGTRRRRVAKLIDFGLACRISSMKTSTDVVTGTPHYVAPERTSGAPATVVSDVYALGVLGYLLLTGTLPFEGTPMEILLGHVHTPPDPLSTRRGERVDPVLQMLISRALAKDVHRRHPTAAAFRYELNNAIDMLELGHRHSRSGIRGTL